MSTSATSKIIAGLVSSAFLVSAAHAESCKSGETYIDPNNDARVGDYVGANGGTISVAYVDASSREPVCTRLWRDSDPGGRKDLDTHCGGRTLTVNMAAPYGRYSVFVHNTTGRPICAWPSDAKVIPIPIPALIVKTVRK